MSTHGPCIVCGVSTAHGCTDCDEGHLCSSKCYKSEIGAAHRNAHSVGANLPNELAKLEGGTVHHWFGIFVTNQTWNAIEQKRNKFEMLKQTKKYDGFSKFKNDAQTLWCWVLQETIQHITITDPSVPKSEVIIPISNSKNSTSVALWKQSPPQSSTQVTFYVRYSEFLSGLFKKLVEDTDFYWDDFPFDTYWSCATARDNYDSEIVDSVHKKLKTLALPAINAVVDNLLSRKRSDLSIWKITFTEGDGWWSFTDLDSVKEVPSYNARPFSPNVLGVDSVFNREEWISLQRIGYDEWEEKSPSAMLKEAIYRAFDQPTALSAPSFSMGTPTEAQKMMGMDLFFGDMLIGATGVSESDLRRRITANSTPVDSTKIFRSDDPKNEQFFQVTMRPVIGGTEEFTDLLRGCLEDEKWFISYFFESKLNMRYSPVEGEIPGFLETAVADLYYWLEDAKSQIEDNDLSATHDLVYTYTWKSTEEKSTADSDTEVDESTSTKIRWIERRPRTKPKLVEILSENQAKNKRRAQARPEPRLVVVEPAPIRVEPEDPILIDIAPEPVIDNPPVQQDDPMDISSDDDDDDIPQLTGGTSIFKIVEESAPQADIPFGSIHDWFGIAVTPEALRDRDEFNAAMTEAIGAPDLLKTREEYFVKNRRWVWCYLLAEIFSQIEIYCPTLPVGKKISMTDSSGKYTHWIPSPKTPKPIVIFKLQYKESIMKIFKDLVAKKQFAWKRFQSAVFFACVTSRDNYDWKNPNYIHSKLAELSRSAIPAIFDEISKKRSESFFRIQYTLEGDSWAKSALSPLKSKPTEDESTLVGPILFDSGSLETTMEAWVEEQGKVQGEWEDKTRLQYSKDSLLRSFVSPQTLETPFFSTGDNPSDAQLMMGLDVFFSRIEIATQELEPSNNTFRIASRAEPTFSSIVREQEGFSITFEMSPLEPGEARFAAPILYALRNIDFFSGYLWMSRFKQYPYIDESHLQKSLFQLFEWLVSGEFVGEQFPKKAEKVAVTIDYQRSLMEEASLGSSEEEIEEEVTINMEFIEPGEKVKKKKAKIVAPTKPAKVSPQPNPDPNPPIFVQPPGVPPAPFVPPRPPTPPPQVDVIPEPAPLPPVVPIPPALRMEPIKVKGKSEKTIQNLAQFRGAGGRKIKAEMLKTLTGKKYKEWVKGWQHETVAAPALLLDCLFDIGIRAEQASGATVYKIIPVDASDVHWPENTKPASPLTIGIKLKGSETDTRRDLWGCYEVALKNKYLSPMLSGKSKEGDEFRRLYWKSRFTLPQANWAKLVNQPGVEADKLSVGLFEYVLSELEANAKNISPEGSASFFYLDESKKWKERRQLAGLFFVGNKLVPDVAAKRKAEGDSNPSSRRRISDPGVVEDVIAYFDNPKISMELQRKFETMSGSDWADDVTFAQGSCFLVDKLVKSASVLVENTSKGIVQRFYQQIPLKQTQDAWDKKLKICLPVVLRFEFAGSETTNRTKAWVAAKEAVVNSFSFFSNPPELDLVRVYFSQRFNVPSKNFEWNQLPVAEMDSLYKNFTKALKRLTADPPTQSMAVFFKFDKRWKTSSTGVVYPNYINGKLVGMPNTQRDESNEWLFDTKSRSFAAFNKLLESRELWKLREVGDVIFSPDVKRIYLTTYLALTLLKSVSFNFPTLSIEVDPKYYKEIEALPEVKGFSFHRLVAAKMVLTKGADEDLVVASELLWSLMRSGAAGDLLWIKEGSKYVFYFKRNPDTWEKMVQIIDVDRDIVTLTTGEFTKIIATLPAYSPRTLAHRLVHPDIFTIGSLMKPLIIRENGVVKMDLDRVMILQGAWRDERAMEYLFYLKIHHPVAALLLLLCATVGDLTLTTPNQEFYNREPTQFFNRKSSAVKGKEEYITLTLNTKWIKYMHGITVRPPTTLSEFLILYRGSRNPGFASLKLAAPILDTLWDQMLKGSSILANYQTVELRIVNSAVYVGDSTMPLKLLHLITGTEVRMAESSMDMPIVHVGHEKTQRSEFDFIRLEHTAGVLLLEHAQISKPEGYLKRQVGVKTDRAALKEILENLIVCTEFWDVSCGNFTVRRGSESVTVTGYHRPRKHKGWDLQIKFLISNSPVHKTRLMAMAKTGALSWSGLRKVLPLPQGITLFTTNRSVKYFVHLICEKEVNSVVLIYSQESERWALVSPDSPLEQLW